MTPDISEFSYGFALTHELIDQPGYPLRAAPIFPSLIEEGRSGGGYDVYLDLPGFPLFLQFKRADCMKRSNARELQQGLHLSRPFYRLKITEKARSDQHDLLLALDNGVNEVFYAAPMFHRVQQLNAAYLARKVAARSFYIRPRDIGPLDDGAHHVAFDTSHFYICSDPREVPGVQGLDFARKLEQRLKREDRPLRAASLDAALESVEIALQQSGILSRQRDLGRADKTEEARKFRTLADLSLRYFGTQLFIVQRAEIAQP
jgi:hypothetical protein